MMERPNINDIKERALRIYEQRYSTSKVVFLAGSFVRGEATESSDIDLVVVYSELEAAYRESFLFEGQPVEAFVHDPKTLEYFFEKVDRPTGVPSLATMVNEGIELPRLDAFSQSIKNLASEHLRRGPDLWSQDQIDRSRYMMTDLLDDIRHFRTDHELYATASLLQQAITDFYFRTQGLWSTKGKHIPRKLLQVDETFAHAFEESFSACFKESDPSLLIALTESLLQSHGGLLFDGFKLEAPKEWQKN